MEPKNESRGRGHKHRHEKLAGALAAGLAWAVLGVAAGTAQAGEYHVYSCRTPAGDVAPIDGWSYSSAGSYGLEADGCAGGDSLIAALYSGVAHSANADVSTWKFTAPPDEVVTKATLWFTGDVLGGVAGSTAYDFWVAAPTDNFGSSDVLSHCYATNCSSEGDPLQPLSTANRLLILGGSAGLQNLYLNASCDGPSNFAPCAAGNTADGYAAAIHLYAADIVLSEQVPPIVTDVGGGLVSMATVSSITDISLKSADSGSGVYEAVFAIDGAVVQSRVLDNNNGRCQDLGSTSDGLPAFLYAKSCPVSLSEDISFDTRNISDGQHHLVVKVIDAAGNATVALDRTITVLNHPVGSTGPGASTAHVGSSPITSLLGQAFLRGPYNGTDAYDRVSLIARWAHARGAAFVSGYGRGTEILGKLSGSDRQGVGGAAMDVSWVASYLGAHPVVLPAAHTAPDGSFLVRLPADSSSGTVRLAYRSHLGDVAPVAVRSLSLGVRAALALRIAPRITSVGRTIYFDGQLRGGPIPAGGKQLVLEARSPGSAWIDFKVIRTDARGRFHSTYRFRFPGPASYQFRALSRYEVAFPFVSGSSNVVGVQER